ncbi:hypothetical protein KFE25_012647 [Diacronema lutheri]|uniref:Uncharacterized protein n=1 Tax=Diacronema lutheri TaxID=2081491 RepID=A0A8J5X0Y3_DIALT|nr:hypothetical protein KFE25_012647 [Diacronema lutheri]
MLTRLVLVLAATAAVSGQSYKKPVASPPPPIFPAGQSPSPPPSPPPPPPSPPPAKVPVPPGVVTPPGAKCIPPFAECFKEPKKDDLLCCEGAICKPHRQAKKVVYKCAPPPPKVIKIVCIDKKYVKCTTDKADLSYAPCCEPKVCKEVSAGKYRCAYP